MKIFDCFMYFDEKTVLELRLNILNKYVDYFVIVESSFTHKGDKRDLKFNHQKFKKFEDKLIYITYDEEPSEIAKNQVNEKDNEAIKLFKKLGSGKYRLSILFLSYSFNRSMYHLFFFSHKYILLNSE